jgi:hypothetical protein
MMKFANLVGLTELERGKLRNYLGQKSDAKPVADGNGD